MKLIEQFNEYEDWLRRTHPWLYYTLAFVIMGLAGILIVTVFMLGGM